MRSKILTIFSNTIFRGTAIFFFGSMVVSFGSFLYHLLMARYLGPTEYGILASLVSLVYLASIPTGTLDLLVSKVVASFEPDEIYPQSKAFVKYLFFKLNKPLILVFVVLLVATYPLQIFLKLPDLGGLLSVWLIICLLIILTVFRSLQKGLLDFVPLVVNQIFEVIIRLAVSLGLLYVVSQSHMVGQIGTMLAFCLALIIVSYQLKPVLAAPNVVFDNRKWSIRNLGIGSLLFSLSFTLMYSIDILLVKHFFSHYLAGIYAVLATTGKIIYFASSPLGSALVPIVAKKSHHPEKARNDLLIFLGIVLGMGVGLLVLYSLIPQQIITLIFTNKYLEAASLLPQMGLAMLFYAISNSCSTFLISLGKVKSAILPMLALVAEIGLIVVWHSSLSQVVGVITLVFGILALILSGYSFYVTRKTDI